MKLNLNAVQIFGLTLFLAFSSLISCSTGKVKVANLESISLKKDLNQKVKFTRHEDNRPGRAYVAVNVAYDSVGQLREDLEKRLKRGLVRRNEAHITLITPPEIEALKPCMDAKQLGDLAEKNDLQNKGFNTVCLGEGSATLEGRKENTYFVVVEFEPAYKFRTEVAKSCEGKIAKGLFDPDRYYPHITVGFTSRDLHLEDGVNKGPSSCKFNLVKE